MSKYTLEYEPEYEFELIGISSALPDYKIAWLLNREIRINLTRIKDHTPPSPVMAGGNELSLIKNYSHELRYPIFSSQNEEMEESYYLVTNRCNKKYLSPDTRGFDYLLRVESSNFDVQECISKLETKKIFNLIKQIEIEEIDLEFMSFLN